MASLFEVLRDVREDVIVNRVMAVSPDTSFIGDQFSPYGSPVANDDGAGKFDESPGPPWRKFEVEITGLSDGGAGLGADAKDWDASIQIVVSYPPTINGQISAHADAAAIWKQLRDGSNFPTGLQAYFPSDGETTFDERDDTTLMIMQVRARITADC